MQKAQVSLILKLVATIDGGQLPRDRAQLLRRINNVRQMLWNNEAFREGAMRTDSCSMVDTFREECRNGGCSPVTYTGITLPPLVCNITEIMRDGRMAELVSSRVDPQGENCCGGPCMVAEELPPHWLEWDIPFGSNARVVFRVEDSMDNKLMAGVRYVNYGGNEVREDLVLHTDGVVTSVSVLHFLEITLPERCGWIDVRTEDGFKLGRYHPSIYNPQHGHFRINSACCGQSVSWRGLQEPYNLVFDSDPVEFSSEPTWKICLALETLLAQVEMTQGQRAGEASLTAKLAAFFSSDLSAKNKNFSGRLMPRNRHQMFGAAKLFSGVRKF